MKISVFLVLGMLVISLQTNAQDSVKVPVPIDRISLGLGGGLDFGGFGGNLLVYPQKNIGLFAGVGYALAGAGYNAGIKIRMVSMKNPPKVHTSLMVMYGYNAAVAVANANEFNKFFYGFSFGLCIDLRSKPQRIGYLSLALLIPVRDPEVKTYIDDLKNNHGVEFSVGLIPIAISVGYRFILNP